MAKKQTSGEKKIFELEAQLAESKTDLADCEDLVLFLKKKLSTEGDPLIATGLRLAQANEVLRNQVARLEKDAVGGGELPRKASAPE